ncbi:MAG: 3-phosphoshikimate 1-carboxyvinyltransferase [Flavobacteriales bacterium]|nr:3-phosphoshikimate 1-carboxyvinyltransferase [Flavobacteriales bacterium]
MTITVHPSTLEGTVRAPGSKSLMQRFIVAALLANGKSTLHHPAENDDSFHALKCAALLGAEAELHDEYIEIEGGKHEPPAPLNVGESGLGMRLFTPIAAMSGFPVEITGEGSLLTRPLTAFEEVFATLGAQIDTTDGHLPAVVKGPLTGGNAVLDGSVSSQFLSGLLMALPLAKEDSTLQVESLKSIPYVDMTLEVLASFGIEITHDDYRTFHIKGNQQYQPISSEVEGDWSAGATLLVAGALASNRGILIEGLSTTYTQADRAITGPLLFGGAKLMHLPNGIRVQASKLKSFDFDATDCPDLFPVMAALAVGGQKKSTIKGVHRLKHKESDRGLAIQQEFKKAGIQVDLDGDVMTIHPGKPAPCTMDSHNDHRIVMAAALLGLIGGPIRIERAEAIGKSYPGFFEDLKDLGAILK